MPPKNPHAYSFRYVRVSPGKNSSLAAVDSLIQQYQPDIVYFRYPCASKELWQFIQRHPRVVFEHNTLEEAELERQLHVDETRWGRQVLARVAGICGVTDEILHYEQKRAGGNKPGLMLGNGIEPASVPPLDHNPAKGAIHLLCSANFAHWHGVDRLLYGMAAYSGPEPFVLHLAGTGQEIQGYWNLVQQLQLENKVYFHGQLDHTALNKLAATCHVGVGALALHRKAMAESTALKHREYCLQGLPFFFSGRDVDFDPLPDFTRSISLNDEPIQMDALVALARLPEQRPGLREEMRRYGEERLSWQVKCVHLYEFLRHCAEKSPHIEVLPPPQAITPVIALDMATAEKSPVSSCAALAVTLQSLRDSAHDTAPFTSTVVSGPHALAAEAATLWEGQGGALQNIVYVPHEASSPAQASGHWQAWNVGMQQAVTPWLLPLRAGDRLSPDLPEALARALCSQPELNMLTAGAQDMEGKEYLPQSISGMLDKKESPAACLLFRKSLWEDVGGYSDLLPFGMTDWLFWMRCLAKGMLRRHLPRVCLFNGSPRPLEYGKFPIELEPTAFAMLATILPQICPLETLLAAQRNLLNMPIEAVRAVRATLERQPNEAWPHFCMGLFHEGKGEAAAAIACQRTATRLDAEAWQPHLRLYFLHGAMGSTRHKEEDKKACLERWAELEAFFAKLEGPQTKE